MIIIGRIKEVEGAIAYNLCGHVVILMHMLNSRVNTSKIMNYICVQLKYIRSLNWNNSFYVLKYVHAILKNTFKNLGVKIKIDLI